MIIKICNLFYIKYLFKKINFNKYLLQYNILTNKIIILYGMLIDINCKGFGGYATPPHN